MSGGYGGLTTGYIVSGGTQVTTTEVVTDIQNALTNIDTKSDAWGKVIPVSFGRCRIAGALVWASQFYRTTSSFDDTTTTKDIYTAYGVAFGTDAEALGGTFGENITLDPQDVSTSKSQVTHIVQTATFIDLCYSFGKEGDTRKKRYIDKIRINNIIAFDSVSGYIASGLGFSVRYGYDDAIPSLLAQYPNGIYHYPGQTLVIFNRFPLANYGDKIPDSIDVEFGCCLSDSCAFALLGDRTITRNNDNSCRIQPDEFSDLQVGDIFIAVIAKRSGTSDQWIPTDWTTVKTQDNVSIYSNLVTANNIDAFKAGFDLVTPSADGSSVTGGISGSLRAIRSCNFDSPLDKYWIDNYANNVNSIPHTYDDKSFWFVDYFCFDGNDTQGNLTFSSLSIPSTTDCVGVQHGYQLGETEGGSTQDIGSAVHSSNSSGMTAVTTIIKRGN